MSNFAKIVILILIVLSFFFIKEKYGKDIAKMTSSFPKISISELVRKNNTDKEKLTQKPNDEKNTENNQEKEYVNVYFLALDSDDNGIYKKVQREIPQGDEKLDYALKELLKGPNMIEKAQGTYTEIPKTTKILSVKQTKDKVVIDLSDDFQYGGGTDSIYSRMMQLIKTAVTNTKNQKIYLYLDGKQVNFIGGEGIMITQPLTEKSLEI